MHIDLAYLLRQYGYLTVLVGTFCEGETVVLAGAWAAAQGYLNLYGVLACAFVGSFAGDQFYFLLGCWVGKPWLARRPRWSRAAERVMGLLAHYQSLFIIAFRFLYGLRTVAPLVLGASGMPLRIFMPFNLLGAAMWATSITLGGAALVECFAAGTQLWANGQFAATTIALTSAVALAAVTFLPTWRR